MSDSEMRADKSYEAQNPAGEVPADNDYQSRTGQSQIPVQKDEASVEDPIDRATADSDETLAADESAAMDKSNIIDERTRGAAKSSGTYTEPGDEEVRYSDSYIVESVLISVGSSIRRWYL